MKKITFIIAATLLFIGCKSKEEKANEIIKRNLCTLYDLEGYEPINTKIDSAFNSIYNDTIVLKHAHQILYIYTHEAKPHALKLDEKEHLINLMTTAGLSFNSSSVVKAIMEYRETVKKLEACNARMAIEQDSIIERAKLIKRDFCGWNATHEFKFKDENGKDATGKYMYILDKDFKKVIYLSDLYTGSYDAMKGAIDEALESKKESDETDSKNKNEL